MVSLKPLGIRLGLLLLLYSVCRTLFLSFNAQAFRDLQVPEILSAFVIGLRFDVAAICLTNSLFILFSSLPGPFQQRLWYQRFLTVLFLVSNVPFLLLNVIDLEYFKFIGQRSSLNLADMRADIPKQLGQLAFHYWYLVVVAGLLIFPVCYFVPKQLQKPMTPGHRQRSWTWFRSFLIMAGVVSLAVIGGRGGWQPKALTPANAHVFDATILSHLALNSSYTFLRARHSCQALESVHFFATDAELRKEFSPRHPSAHSRDDRRENLVIIVVESLSSEYMGGGEGRPSYTPFLDGLAARGVFFKNNLANARRTIDALAPILAGLPHLNDSTFICSMSREVRGIGSILRSRGYQTSFFHGGRNGTMYFDVFSKRMGFDRYYGLNEYPEPADSDGVWGIYDEPFLQFAAQKLSHGREPFAAVVWTLSSHNPYRLPPRYRDVLPKGERPIHQSIGYADLALKRFFETAEKMPWYRDTLFVVTGDHTEVTRGSYSGLVDTYRVPLIFFHPGRKLPAVDPARITQHMDIVPSVMDVLGFTGDRVLPFGNSVFDSSFDGSAVGHVYGIYWLMHKDHYLEYRAGGPSKLFDPVRDPGLRSPITDRIEVERQLERKLKAYIQWFNNGLAKNDLYRLADHSGDRDRLSGEK